MSTKTIGIIGSGTMGIGIAQVAASAGHQVKLFDQDRQAITKALEGLKKILARQVEKGRMTQEETQTIIGRIQVADSFKAFSECGLVIEAIIENPDIKKKVFSEVERHITPECVVASNTSSLSIALLSSALEKPERFLGIHFFNPAPLMPLVEIVPGVATNMEIAKQARALIDSWGKITVMAKDTPGFIVNRVARPFYGEAIRILEEGVADAATIDWAMKELGGFRMGPFELMDFIGHDVNYTVTETVFEAFFYDPRFKPSFTQKRLVEAGFLGRKSGRGFYDYADDVEKNLSTKDKEMGEQIVRRILMMLINEAADAVFLNVATKQDIELAMTRGVNYPKGLLAWADEIGIEKVLANLEALYAEYGEDRYRPNPILRRMARDGRTFFDN